MTQILSTAYLLILLCFLILLCYYISGEILKNIQEENIFNLPQTIKATNGPKLDELFHLNLAKVYTKKEITDAALYELYFLILSGKHSCSDKTMSNLYGLLGKNLESIKNYDEAIQCYLKATTLFENNRMAENNLAKLIQQQKASNRKEKLR
nr:Ycf37 [Erythrotrichia longistipitata]